MRTFVQALRSIRRSPYQALSASLVLFLTFFIGYSLVLFLLGSAKVLAYFESRPQVTGFFNQATSLEVLQQHQQRLLQEPYVQKVELVSQEQALEIYRSQTANDPLLQELVTADILPPSLEVSTISIDDLGKVAETMKTMQGIDEVVYQQDVVDSLRYWTRTLRQVGAGVLGIFVVTSLLVVILITSMRIASKKYETRVMRLIGATKWYIMKPFLIEGMLYGIIGAALSWLVVYITVLYATPTVQGFFGEINLLPVPPLIMGILLAGGICLAMLLGFIASYISARRLFKV
jgi:cell division transport system permease protein